MSDRAISGIVLLLILLVGAGGIGGYYYGRHQGFAKGYSTGEKVGYDQGKADAPPVKTFFVEYTNLQNDYNSLVNDYNNLRNDISRYVSANSYKVRTPITCNTFDYSSIKYSTTTCY